VVYSEPCPGCEYRQPTLPHAEQHEAMIANRNILQSRCHWLAYQGCFVSTACTFQALLRTDALAKLLIEKGLITREEFMQNISGRA